MLVLVFQAVGILVFLAGSMFLGSVARRHSDSSVAENASRISHLLFWCGLILPGTVGVFHPGLAAYDGLLGMPSLPVRPVWIVTGAILLSVGVVLVGASNRRLMSRGKGAASFLLTEELVTDGVYGRTRNPMSLGLYTACLGVGMIAGSLTVTLAVLLIVIPVHIINLRYFEECELRIRYGQSYVDYAQRVPFLIPQFRRG